MSVKFTEKRASAIRMLIRALLICITAFGLDLSADQVAAVQLVAEAAIQAVTVFLSPTNPNGN